ncbi:MAG: hypothetical protein ACLQIB_14360 [Isosphaeraceae bacterium]
MSVEPALELRAARCSTATLVARQFKKTHYRRFTAMKSTDWIDLDEAACRLSGTTEEITCLVREGILGTLIDRDGALFVQAAEIDRLVEVFPPPTAPPRGPHKKNSGSGRS